MLRTRYVNGNSAAVRGCRGRSLLARDLSHASMMEHLEGRQLLAAISWDGGAGDNLWHSPANWSGDVVPAAADDVTIDIAATPTILLNSASGSRAVNSLVLRENLTISGGSTLTVGTTASIDGGAVLALNNGRLAGGTWSLTNGSLALDQAPDNRLTGLTWNGPINLPDASDRLSFGTGVTVNGVITVSGANAELGFVNGASLNTEIAFPGGAGGRRMGATASGATYTLGPASNVHGGAFTIANVYAGSGWNNVSVVSQGTIAANIAGQTITISPATFTSTGTLAVNPGNLTIAPANPWNTSAATVNVNGTLTIDGTYSTGAGIGTWNRTGGAVNIVGTVNNDAGLLNLNASTGVWDLTGGTITGGTLNLLAGGGLGLNTNPANRLANLVVNGDITLADAGDRLSIGVGVTVNGVISVPAANAEIGLVNGAVINSEVSFPGSVTGRRIGATASGATYTLGPASNIHGGAFTIANVYAGSGWNNVSVVSQGAITADVAGQTITINPANFTSSGALNANPGNITIAPSNAWNTSAATVTVNATLTIDGTYTTGAGIGTWNRLGGAVNIVGTINNDAGTLNLDTSTGAWDLAGGTITGGTLNLLAGGGLGMNSNPANRIANLTVNGNITLADAGDRLSIGTGVTMNGVITVAAANAEIGLVNGAVINSEIVFPGAVGGRRIGATASGAAYTLGPASNIHGGGFTIANVYAGSGWNNVSVVSQGTITSEVAGQTVTINPANFTSTGILNANPGNMTLAPSNAWSTTGATVNVNATLTIDGTYITGAGIGTWNRIGGAVNIVGTINNASGVLNLDATTGVWDLTGGTITGGTVNFLAGGGIGVNSNPANRFSSVIINGNVDLPDASDRLSFGQTVTINGVTTLSGVNSELGLVNGAVLNSEIVFPGTATGRRIGATASGITYTLGPAANVHGGPFTIGNVYAGSGWNNVTVVNQGTIAADVAGQTAVINPAVFENLGVLTAGPGNLTVNTGQTWSTTGTVNINNVTFSIDGTLVTAGGIGTWNRTGGVVNVPGLVQNSSGNVILNAGTGEWTLTGGRITGGTVTIAPGGGLGVNSNPANRLDNVVVNGSILLADATDRLSFAANVAINSGAVVVSGVNAEIGLAHEAVFSGEIHFPGAAAGRRIGATSSNSTYTLGPGAHVHGGLFTIGNVYAGSGWNQVTVVNQGAITADVVGQTVTINPAIFNNTGTVAANPGVVTIAPSSAMFTNAGTLLIAPGSQINVTGAYTQTAKGTLHVLLDGPAASDIGRLVVSGNATLDGAVEVEIAVPLNLECMNSVFLNAPAVFGEFSSRTLPPPPGDHQSIVVYTGIDVRFAISPPSDYNQDGVLNSQDYFDFLTDFFEGC